jgi:hypothetical protein
MGVKGLIFAGFAALLPSGEAQVPRLVEGGDGETVPACTLALARLRTGGARF